MTDSTVPDYFQEETEAALREQVEWLVREVGVDDSFFGRLLGREPAEFGAWRASKGSLLPEEESNLRKLWHTTLHLLSFLNFEEVRVRDLFQQQPSPLSREDSPLAPPWAGSSLRSFLEKGGDPAINQVNRWVTGLRFGDPYAA